MKAAQWLLACFAVISAETSANAQAQPFTSFRRLVTANGFAPAVIDLEARRLTILRENMYRYPAPGIETRNLAYDLYLGLRAAGQSRWLTDVRLDEAGYETGTNLIRTVQRDSGLRVTTHYVAPMSLEARALLIVAEVVNEGPDTSDVALFSIHNFHLGSGPDRTTGERVRWDASFGAYLETGAGSGTLIIKPLTPASRHTASPNNPFPLVNEDQLFTDVEDSGVRDDAVSGLQFDAFGRAAFPRGASFRVAFAVAWAPSDVASTVAAIDAFHRGRDPSVMLEDERVAWREWHRAGVWPVTIDAAEQRVAEQALAILRTGQVREPGAPNGQILASLPPGMWDIAWIRDGTLAIEALIATEHWAEAEAALEFFIRGPFNAYQSYVGRSYGLSVARYYGNGAEESDSNQNGPNIELDGFGLYLKAAANYVRNAPNGAAWLARRRAHLDQQIADVLVFARDAATGLIFAESSIWESHWDNGARQRWIFTSGTAAIGLAAWADVLPPNDPRVATYRARSSELVTAMRTHLIDPASGALAASVEQLARGDGRFADAQAALILDPITFPPSSATGLATLDFLRNRLFLSATTRRGYKRNDDGDLYDEREWAVIDLGISRALRAAGRTADADVLIAWLTGQAEQNFLLLPELLDQNDARYAGEVPMIGFGAGAYLTTLIDRSGVRAVDPPVQEDAGFRDAGSDAAIAEDGTIHADAAAEDAIAALDATTPLPMDAGLRADAATQTPRAQSSCSCSSGERDRSLGGWLSVVMLLLVARRTQSRD